MRTTPLAFRTVLDNLLTQTLTRSYPLHGIGFIIPVLPTPLVHLVLPVPPLLPLLILILLALALIHIPLMNHGFDC